MFGHFLAAQQIWHTRLHVESTSVVVWPNLSLKAIKTWMNIQHCDWEAYLLPLENKDLSRVIIYTTTKGVVYQNIGSEDHYPCASS
ncbi:MAG: hypothetical protein J0L94_16555 [Rhodothermia bacterium]|nr:hypothetical protein [Rhodothermia bacterium]